ncbi:hypothetical protein BDL97_02G007700 [Sphagnum fallax]|nr:hypothetical protein BDL97_02G007700 [Sphagnum fallax]
MCTNGAVEALRIVRACRPYAGFIQLWLYHATVEDPFEEFIVKCAEGNGMPLSPPSTASGLVSKQTSMSSFQVRTGVSVPSFLEAVCTPLLRAGQQLQVLSKLLETHQQQIGHVVTTVQYYVESQLHHVVWGRFVDSVQQQVKDIHDLEQVHSAYRRLLPPVRRPLFIASI